MSSRQETGSRIRFPRSTQCKVIVPPCSLILVNWMYAPSLIGVRSPIIGWRGDRSGGRAISPKATSFRCYVRPRDGEVPQLIIEIEGPDKSIRHQDIALLTRRDSARPRHFLFPVERCRTDVLYFRNGIFASRTAHFLRYPKGGKIGVIREMEKKP